MTRRAGYKSHGPQHEAKAASGAFAQQQPATPLSSQSDVLKLHRAVGNRAVETLIAHDSHRWSSRSITLPRRVRSVLARAAGRTLDTTVRTAMEARFAHDFRQVRVHTDRAATKSADLLGARAYTVGQDIVFGTGQFDPQSVEGRQLLAHELTHVVQQSLRGATTNAAASESEAAATARSISHVAGPLAVMSAAPVGIQCQLYDRGAAEQRLKELQKKINAKEKEFGETGAHPSSDAEYQDMRAEYLALHDQLKASQGSGKQEIFSASKPMSRLSVSGTTVDLQAPPHKPSAPPPKGERTTPLQISPFGKPITLMEADIQDPVRRHRVHNLQVDIKAIHDQTQHARWAWQAALSEWVILRKSADWVAGVDPPSFSILEAIHNLANQAFRALELGELDEAGRFVEKAQKSLVNARSAWQRYRLKNIEGAETIKTGLEYTRDASFLTLAILAPGAGAVGGVIATAAPIAAEVGGAAIQVALGDEVDWTRAAVNVAVSLLVSRFGPAATNAIMKGVVARIGTQTVARDVILKIIQNEIVNVGSIALGTVANAALDALRGKKVTWRGVCEQMLAQLASPSGHIAVLVSTRAQMKAGKAGAAPSTEAAAATPPASQPSAVRRPSKPAQASKPQAGAAEAPLSRQAPAHPSSPPSTEASRAPAGKAAAAAQPAAAQTPSPPVVAKGTAVKPAAAPTRAKRRTPQQMAAASVAERKAAERAAAEARAASKKASEEAALAARNAQRAKTAAERAKDKAAAPAGSKAAAAKAKDAAQRAKTKAREARTAATAAQRKSVSASKQEVKASQRASAKRHAESVARERAAAAGGKPTPATTIVGFGKRRRQELIAFWEQKIKRTKSAALKEKYQDFKKRVENREMPDPRQSEMEMEFFYKRMGGTAQAAYKHGRRSTAAYDKETGKWVREGGRKIPDITYSAAMVEVKRYQIQNKAKLIAKLVEQVEDRRLHGPATVKNQAIILDLRGQQAHLREINQLVRDVAKATQVPLDYIQVLTW
jgi:hypothetical protein